MIGDSTSVAPTASTAPSTSAASSASAAPSTSVVPHITSVNVSQKKGTRKQPVASGEVEVIAQHGCTDDAHAGAWHRQVSFLAEESIDKAKARGLDVKEGDFGENFTTIGIDLVSLPLGTKVRLGDKVLCEISQIGKVCHTRCAIYYLAGDCIFPREGIFAVVLEGGTVRTGDPITVVELGDGTCEFTPQEALDELAARNAEAEVCNKTTKA